MRITKIEPQKNDPTRRNIYVDEEFALGVSAETLIRFGLRSGDTIDGERLKALEQSEGTAHAKRVALRFLRHRPRTRKEIHDKLREKEFSSMEIEQTVSDLESAGLLNDQEFARMFIRSTLSSKPTGKHVLRRKLLLLGVDKPTTESAIDELLGGVDQTADALEAARKYLKRATAIGRGQEQAALRKKVGAFLMRRGFGWEIIAPVLKSLFTATGTEESIE